MSTPLALDLKDLRPAEATLKLSDFPDKEFHLKKFTLNDRIWCHQKWGAEKVQEIFNNQSLPEIGAITYRLLKEKEQFKKEEDFFEAIVTLEDQANVIMALLKCIGISEAIFQKLSKEFDEKNAESPNQAQLTGAQSSTSLPQNTATP